ncbi:MAG: hypothetical protein ACXABY_30865 [Candidatus Thorarchaeota archaeon]
MAQPQAGGSRTQQKAVDRLEVPEKLGKTLSIGNGSQENPVFRVEGSRGFQRVLQGAEGNLQGSRGYPQPGS